MLIIEVYSNQLSLLEFLFVKLFHKFLGHCCFYYNIDLLGKMLPSGE
jgi:hypothetical protein